jgi:hypothetical protein
LFIRKRKNLSALTSSPRVLRWKSAGNDDTKCQTLLSLYMYSFAKKKIENNGILSWCAVCVIQIKFYSDFLLKTTFQSTFVVKFNTHRSSFNEKKRFLCPEKKNQFNEKTLQKIVKGTLKLNQSWLCKIKNENMHRFVIQWITKIDFF